MELDEEIKCEKDHKEGWLKMLLDIESFKTNRDVIIEECCNNMITHLQRQRDLEFKKKWGQENIHMVDEAVNYAICRMRRNPNIEVIFHYCTNRTLCNCNKTQ